MGVVFLHTLTFGPVQHHRFPSISLWSPENMNGLQKGRESSHVPYAPVRMSCICLQAMAKLLLPEVSYSSGGVGWLDGGGEGSDCSCRHTGVI